MNRFYLLLLFSLGSFQLIAAAETFSLDQAVESALRNHPELQAARTSVSIAQARLIDVGKLENPIFEFSLTSQPKDGADREGTIFMGYSQAFPVTAKLLRERDLGVLDVKLAYAEILDVEREFIKRIQQSYIDAVSAQSSIEILKQLESESLEYVALAKGQVAQAAGSELDVASAETENALATQARRLAEHDYQQALAELRPLLG